MPQSGYYMTTGELARIMGITKETLFHYDEIHLFCPQIVKENKYRYYSVDQIEMLDTILLLKELGIPLKEIRSLLENRSPEKMAQFLREREVQIQQEITKLRDRKRWVAQRRERLEHVIHQDLSAVHVCMYPKRYCLDWEKSSDENELFKKANAMVTEFLMKNSGFQNEYRIAYQQNAKEVEHGIYGIYDRATLLLQKKPKGMKYQEIPAGNYLVGYHVGHWDTIGESYARIYSYKKAHGLHTSDVYLEYYLVDGSTVEDIKDYVTEIAVRIL